MNRGQTDYPRELCTRTTLFCESRFTVTFSDLRWISGSRSVEGIAKQTRVCYCSDSTRPRNYLSKSSSGPLADPRFPEFPPGRIQLRQLSSIRLVTLLERSLVSQRLDTEVTSLSFDPCLTDLSVRFVPRTRQHRVQRAETQPPRKLVRRREPLSLDMVSHADRPTRLARRPLGPFVRSFATNKLFTVSRGTVEKREPRIR